LQLQLQSNQRTKILSAFEAQKVDSDNEQQPTPLAMSPSTPPTLIADSLDQVLPQQSLQLSTGLKGVVERVVPPENTGSKSPLIGVESGQRRSAARRLKKKPTELMRSATAPLDLDVGGVRYRTSLTTLQSVPDSMLGAMFSGRFELARQLDGSIFIDRDGRLFGHVLNWLRDRQIVTLSNADRAQLRAEASFYQLKDLLTALDEEDAPFKQQVDLTRMDVWRAYSTAPHNRNFRGLRLVGIDLSYFDLQKSDFTGADLRNVNFNHCNLSSANMSNCNLGGASLRECDLRKANLTGANLRQASLHDAALLEANLSNANFKDAVLTNANFTNANLTNANLSEAKFKRSSVEMLPFRN